jgi:cobalt-zinc-cadmium resistance protein CzcA
MEESDVIIRLKPKSEWVSASSKDELANKFKEALSIIPGMEVEFTQPIEMRFNELITGVRADIAVKVFGEDLEILNRKANEIKKAISGIEGAADIIVEKIDGLPQMNVKYDRSKIARYGLNISDLNDMISMGFSGKILGSVFEGEKRFDLALRLKEDHRRDLVNIENLYVDLPKGGKIPLSELAEIRLTKDAAKISRDDTRRRIVVGINVRNRDLQSVVDDIESVIDRDIKLPVGYSITYGGQFENLQNAKSRLKIAVPISLGLIFLLLYFAFGSVRDALIIFSAIPLSAVGGVLLLWLRDMPFSISAGVGFIALFGIAVLNGIVLIEQFKELRKEMKNQKNDEYIIEGAKSRMRAVFLTAGAAALGFLPMAISTSAGAEVQRPLATVVIGGLVTSTLLTLLVLPVLYSIFQKKRIRISKSVKSWAIVLILSVSSQLNAQETELSFEDLKVLTMQNNFGLKAGNLKNEEKEALVGTAFDFNKTGVYYSYDENNIAFNNEVLQVVGIQQEFLFPTVYFSAKRVKRAELAMVNSGYELEKSKLEKSLALVYNDLQYHWERQRVFSYLDSLYGSFAYAAKRKFELGESNYLEKITAQAKEKEINTEFRQLGEDIEQGFIKIRSIVQTNDTLRIKNEPLKELELLVSSADGNPGFALLASRKDWVEAIFRHKKQQYLPDLYLEYFRSVNSSFDSPFEGFHLGLRIPILFNAKAADVKASRIARDRVYEENRQYGVELYSKYNELQAELLKQKEMLLYYQQEGKMLSEEILRAASLGYQNGEIDFYQYIQSVESAMKIKLSYMTSLRDYNQTVLELNYLTI